MLLRRALPIVGLVLFAYVVFSVTWTLTAPLRVVAPTPTRTPHPTYTPVSDSQVLVAATPSATPTATHTAAPSATPSASPTRSPTSTPTATELPPDVQHVVRSGETLLGIAALYDVEYQALLDANRLADADVLLAGQVITVPLTQPLSPDTGRQHIVRAGETVLGIALAYGVDYAELLLINGLVDPDRIFEGQVLILPEE